MSELPAVGPDARDAKDDMPYDLTLRLLYFLMTEEFEDGQSKSTLLVYFGGVLGLTSDRSGFRRPGNYTANLSAFIYCARLVVIKVLLPRTSHDYVR
ncbi:hypothetical protein CSHISOI_11261 [Colletotrichum shisoi]|uniref:Uncharacterized protein n=1 Tax=Colletotrichum shisoi TaxID=2078593 RepID=A0A5Q4BBD3_9PEZI|nr:hypothetical protein CSHISOI_11261 [Colletotrichum shisoi]